MPTWHSQADARRLLADEVGTIHKEAAYRVALVYPSAYRAAMSSLGYQSIYRVLNELPDVAADRATLPEDDRWSQSAERAPLRTLERDLPVAGYPLVAFSVAYELELSGLFTCLARTGLVLLSSERGDAHPLVLAGGPLTFSNPVVLAPFCDAVVLGEGEDVIANVVATARAHPGRAHALGALARLDSVWVPSVHGSELPAIAKADDARLPARSVIVTPHTELRSMYLVEPARGCSRGCTYCVMRRSTNDGMRMVSPEVVLASIPEHARRVGLVGAAVTDHPRLADIVRGVVASGREIGISSLRADRMTDELVGLLAQGGYQTLTVALDGASERLRADIERKTHERHLENCARWAKAHDLRVLKIYMMLGLPGETDDDVDELARFLRELSQIHSRISLGIAPFVAKRHTPLDGTPFAGIRAVDDRLRRLRGLLRGRVTLRSTSARWAWVEYMLAQGDERAGLAALDAWRQGGRFSDFKTAFRERNANPTGPRARVLSTHELVLARRKDHAAA